MPMEAGHCVMARRPAARPAALRKLVGRWAGTGGTAERPFVYEGFHTP